MSTQTFQVEATVLKLAIEANLSNEVALPILQFRDFLGIRDLNGNCGILPDYRADVLDENTNKTYKQFSILPGRGKREGESPPGWCWAISTFP